jgi:hypothetical protein
MAKSELLLTGSGTRKHHYISACYLKHFATPQKRTGRIYALDKDNKKQYQTTPGDAGCERDFNYIDAEGVSSNYIEDMIGQVLEGDFPNVISYIVDNHKLPKPKSDYYNILMTIASLFVVRNPAMRKKIEDFESRVRNLVADVMVSKKEQWDHLTKRMEQDGYEVHDITFEEVQSFVRERKYEIIYPKGYHVPREMKMMDTVFPFLFNRKWELLISKEEDFISSNKPVSLVPTTSKFAGMPLGFGLSETAVIFPLTNKMCLVGTFEGKFKTRNVIKIEVQHINGYTANSDNRFIYSSKNTFSFLGSEAIKTEKDLL